MSLKTLVVRLDVIKRSLRVWERNVERKIGRFADIFLGKRRLGLSRQQQEKPESSERAPALSKLDRARGDVFHIFDLTPANLRDRRRLLNYISILKDFRNAYQYSGKLKFINRRIKLFFVEIYSFLIFTF